MNKLFNQHVEGLAEQGLSFLFNGCPLSAAEVFEEAARMCKQKSAQAPRETSTGVVGNA